MTAVASATLTAMPAQVAKPSITIWIDSPGLPGAQFYAKIMKFTVNVNVKLDAQGDFVQKVALFNGVKKGWPDVVFGAPTIFTVPDETTRIHLVNDAVASARFVPRLVERDHLGMHFRYFLPYDPLSEHLTADCAMALVFLIDSDEVKRTRIYFALDCSGVFVDSLRNGFRTYCESTTCGARVHTTTYRFKQCD